MLVLLLADSETVTGILREAAVEGLMSWWGEGLRFMEALCRVEASSRAGEGIVGFCLGWGGWGERGGGCEWLEVVCSVCLAPWRPHMSDGLTKTSDGLDRDYRKTIRPSETPQDQPRSKFFEYITNQFTIY